MPVLKALLDSNKNVEIPISDKTVFCCDSEAYRFLAAVKNKDHPVNFLEEEKKIFAQSWEKSTTETKRMLILELTPDTINNTLTIYSASELFQKLTRPVEIGRTFKSLL